MGRKRPMVDLPSASTSEEEKTPENSNSTTEDENAELQQKSTSKTKKPNSGNNSSESHSDSDQEMSPSSAHATDFTVKPIVKAPNAMAKLVQGRSSTKSKGKNKLSVSSSKVTDMKSPFQRVWTEEDELSILQAMIQFKSEKEIDPISNMSAFYDFIKKSLRNDVTKTQLMDKVRRLKDKYRNKVIKGKRGEDLVFTKPHDNQCFQLWKKIWGGESTSASRSMKKRKTLTHEYQEPNQEVGGVVSGLGLAGNDKKDDCQATQPNGCEEVEAQVDSGELLKDYPCLDGCLKLGNSWALPNFCKDLLRVNMTSIGNDRATDFEDKLRRMQLKELKLQVMRVELIWEQAKLALDMAKGSTS